MVKLTITNAAVVLSVLASTSLAQSAYEGVYARGYDSPYARDLDAVRIEARGKHDSGHHGNLNLYIPAVTNAINSQLEARHEHGHFHHGGAAPAPERRDDSGFPFEARDEHHEHRHRHGQGSAPPAPERREVARSWSSRSLTRRAVGSEVDDTGADPLEHAHAHAHAHVHVHTHKHAHTLSEEEEEDFFDIEKMLKTILSDLGIENDEED